jgi:selenocysteine-specific elongation factor
MKHLILGTAGHIDHGKTALIKALTGIECDTHREEKKRGITINLGFAHLPLSTGDTVSIIDVPGHRDFVHTMVAGASGIDFALLVVAADSGVMPQTREHLQIMEMLGIGSGLIAITRTDLTEPDVISLAEEEIKELVHGTFLQDSPIIRVSSKTHEGITSLRSAIETIAVSVTDRPKGEVFRIDRKSVV